MGKVLLELAFISSVMCFFDYILHVIPFKSVFFIQKKVNFYKKNFLENVTQVFFDDEYRNSFVPSYMSRLKNQKLNDYYLYIYIIHIRKTNCMSMGRGGRAFENLPIKVSIY